MQVFWFTTPHTFSEASEDLAAFIFTVPEIQ